MDINGLNGFKIVASVFMPGGVLPIFKIIVHLNNMGPEPMSLQLNGQTVGKGRFPR